MRSDILALLKLFESRARDRETHAWVVELASDENLWPNAQDVFRQIRRRSLECKDEATQCQYYFEEVCLKSLFNETNTDMPFDSDSPHWIIKNALMFARAVGIPEKEIIEIIVAI